METQLIKGRAGSSIAINDNAVVIKKSVFKGETSIKKSDITSVEVKRSVYDLPFLEKTLIINAGGKIYKVKRLPAKEADKLKTSLI